jgi:hypothetical protein
MFTSNTSSDVGVASTSHIARLKDIDWYVSTMSKSATIGDKEDLKRFIQEAIVKMNDLESQSKKYSAHDAPFNRSLDSNLSMQIKRVDEIFTDVVRKTNLIIYRVAEHNTVYHKYKEQPNITAAQINTCCANLKTQLIPVMKFMTTNVMKNITEVLILKLKKIYSEQLDKMKIALDALKSTDVVQDIYVRINDAYDEVIYAVDRIIYRDPDDEEDMFAEEEQLLPPGPPGPPAPPINPLDIIQVAGVFNPAAVVRRPPPPLYPPIRIPHAIIYPPPPVLFIETPPLDLHLPRILLRGFPPRPPYLDAHSEQFREMEPVIMELQRKMAMMESSGIAKQKARRISYLEGAGLVVFAQYPYVSRNLDMFEETGVTLKKRRLLITKRITELIEQKGIMGGYANPLRKPEYKLLHEDYQRMENIYKKRKLFQYIGHLMGRLVIEADNKIYGNANITFSEVEEAKKFYQIDEKKDVKIKDTSGNIIPNTELKDVKFDPVKLNLQYRRVVVDLNDVDYAEYQGISYRSMAPADIPAYITKIADTILDGTIQLADYKDGIMNKFIMLCMDIKRTVRDLSKYSNFLHLINRIYPVPPTCDEEHNALISRTLETFQGAQKYNVDVGYRNYVYRYGPSINQIQVKQKDDAKDVAGIDADTNNYNVSDEPADAKAIPADAKADPTYARKIPLSRKSRTAKKLYEHIREVIDNLEPQYISDMKKAMHDGAVALGFIFVEMSTADIRDEAIREYCVEHKIDPAVFVETVADTPNINFKSDTMLIKQNTQCETLNKYSNVERVKEKYLDILKNYLSFMTTLKPLNDMCPLPKLTCEIIEPTDMDERYINLSGGDPEAKRVNDLITDFEFVMNSPKQMAAKWRYVLSRPEEVGNLDDAISKPNYRDIIKYNLGPADAKEVPMNPFGDLIRAFDKTVNRDTGAPAMRGGVLTTRINYMLTKTNDVLDVVRRSNVELKNEHRIHSAMIQAIRVLISAPPPAYRRVVNEDPAAKIIYDRIIAAFSTPVIVPLVDLESLNALYTFNGIYGGGSGGGSGGTREYTFNMKRDRFKYTILSIDYVILSIFCIIVILIILIVCIEVWQPMKRSMRTPQLTYYSD